MNLRDREVICSKQHCCSAEKTYNFPLDAKFGSKVSFKRAEIKMFDKLGQKKVNALCQRHTEIHFFEIKEIKAL